MTKDEWKEVDHCLSGVFGFAELLVDGVTVRFQRVQLTKNKLGIMTYINGEFQGKWLFAGEQHVESRFLRRIARKKWPAPLRKRWKKMAKKELRALKIDLEETIFGLSPFWFPVSAIKRHYEKTFKSIEFVKAGGY